MDIISSFSTIVLGIVAVIGIWLNYRKESRESKKDTRSDLQIDYERRTALLKEANDKCAFLQDKNAYLEEENSALRREKIDLLAELVQLRIKIESK